MINMMQECSESQSEMPLLDEFQSIEPVEKHLTSKVSASGGAHFSNHDAHHNQSSSNEALSRDSDSKLNEFFNSYISNVDSAQDQRPRAESVCSDSVSKCEGHGRPQNEQRRHAGFIGFSNPNIMQESRYQQLQRSDSSSLVTLATDKKISDSRRTFCLFVTFGLILTTILWLIMCGTSATSELDFFDIVRLQVRNYTVCCSMFDVVCLAAGRFVFLEVAYAAIWIRHWWPVAVSTTIVDILLILKLFPIFQWFGHEQYLKQALPMTVVILLTNFLLTWIEVWFIDFKVLPTEAKLAQRTVRRFLQGQYAGNDPGESAPLLGSSRYQRSSPPASSFYTGAASDKLSYHSVLDSEFGPPDGDQKRGNIFPVKISQEDMVHVERGRKALDQLWALFNNDDGLWKLDKELVNGDRLFSADVPDYGKTFRIDTVVQGVSAQRIFNEIILKAEAMPKWNMAVGDVKILRRIGEQTAVSLEVSKPAARGLIESRDFVTIRRVDKIGNSYVSAGISADFSIPDTGRIRGINGPTGFVVTPCDGVFNCCKFTWILNTKLKGSLPQYLVNSNLSATLVDFVVSMKRHLCAIED